MAQTRRNFFGAAAAASATALTGGTVQAQSAKTKRSGKLLKVGVVTCHPTHHHMPNIWGPIINCVPIRGGKVTPTRMTGMELTHMWDNDPKRVETFCDQFGTKAVKNFDDMTDKVDAVIISDMRNSDVFPELSEPYLKAGVPILYNRPFTSSVGRAKRIIEMSEKHGTPFMTASGWEYCKEVFAMQRKVKEWGPGIRAVSAFNSSYEVTHDVHGVWIIAAMIGVGIESVAVTRKVQNIYERGWDAWSILYKGRDGGEPFYVTLNNSSDHDSNSWVKVILDKGTAEQSLWYLGGDAEQRYQYYFLPPLLEFQRMIERGIMPQLYQHVLEKTAVFIAGFKSHLEKGGAPVKLSELEDDYRVPSDPNTVEYPDGFFG